MLKSPLTQLNQKSVLLTGAARGLGREMLRILLEEGATVWAVDLDQSSLHQVSAEENNPRLHCRPGNILDREFRESLRNEIEKHGSIDILINNAGTVHGGDFLEVPELQHAQTIAVNLSGLILFTHSFLPMLLKSKEAYLINIASASAFLGFPKASSYAASKWGVLGFSESLQLELQAHKQISVSVACPSYIRTELFAGAKAPLFTQSLDPRFLARRILKKSLQKKFLIIDPCLVRALPFVKAMLPHKLWMKLLVLFQVHKGMSSWTGRHRVPPS